MGAKTASHTPAFLSSPAFAGEKDQRSWWRGPLRLATLDTSPANAGEEKRGLAKRRKQSDGEYFNEERFGAPSATRNARNPDEGESHGRTTIQRHPSDRAGGTRRRGKDQPCRSDAVRSRRHRPIGIDGQRLQHRRFQPRSAPARRLDRAQPLQFRLSRRPV